MKYFQKYNFINGREVGRGMKGLQVFSDFDIKCTCKSCLHEFENILRTLKHVTDIVILLFFTEFTVRILFSKES